LKKADIIASILGIFLSAYVFWATVKFPEDNVLLLGPSFFPRIVAGALIFMCVVLLAKALMGKSMLSKDKFDIRDPDIHNPFTP